MYGYANAHNGFLVSYFSRGAGFLFLPLHVACEKRLRAGSSLTEIYDKLWHNELALLRASRVCAPRRHPRCASGARPASIFLLSGAPVRGILKFYKVPHGAPRDLRDRVSNNFEYSPDAVIRLLA